MLSGKGSGEDGQLQLAKESRSVCVISTCVHTCIPVHTRACVCVCVCVCWLVGAPARARVCLRLRLCAFPCVRLYVRAHVHVSVCFGTWDLQADREAPVFLTKVQPLSLQPTSSPLVLSDPPTSLKFPDSGISRSSLISHLHYFNNLLWLLFFLLCPLSLI